VFTKLLADGGSLGSGGERAGFEVAMVNEECLMRCRRVVSTEIDGGIQVCGRRPQP